MHLHVHSVTANAFPYHSLPHRNAKQRIRPCTHARSTRCRPLNKPEVRTTQINVHFYYVVVTFYRISMHSPQAIACLFYAGCRGKYRHPCRSSLYLSVINSGLSTSARACRSVVSTATPHPRTNAPAARILIVSYPRRCLASKTTMSVVQGQLVCRVGA